MNKKMTRRDFLKSAAAGAAGLAAVGVMGAPVLAEEAAKEETVMAEEEMYALVISPEDGFDTGTVESWLSTNVTLGRG